MAVLISDIINNCLRQLRENANSPALDLATGTGGTATIDLTAAMVTLINNAASNLAKSCWYIEGSGTLASLPVATRLIAFSGSGIDTGAMGELWAARAVAYNGARLYPSTLANLQLRYPTWQTDATGVPTHWYPNGENGIGIYPRPATSYDLTIAGALIPPEATQDSSIDWLPKDLTTLIENYICWHIAVENRQNPGLAARAQVWGDTYNDGVAERLAAFMKRDPVTAAWLYGKA